LVQVGIPLSHARCTAASSSSRSSEAAAGHGLPVAVHIETGTGVNFRRRRQANPRTYEQYAAFMGLNYIYHLMNMIAEGVFESLELKVVWADGGAEMLTPFIVAHGHLRAPPPGADSLGPADPERVSPRPHPVHPLEPRRPRQPDIAASGSR
jgi:hypothetical protein